MYNTYTAAQWREYLNLPTDYSVDGVLVFGSNEVYSYDLLYDALHRGNYDYESKRLPSIYLNAIEEITIGGKRSWFFVAYGGAQLSEFMHLACSFGSKQNILLGNCGGLKKGVEAYDLIIPTSSYATESSATIYQPDVKNIFTSNEYLSNELTRSLGNSHVIHRDKMITCQAMFGEGYEHIAQWISEGYVGVEMESATLFAVSNHFGVPSAAILKVIDNLGKHETIVENGYKPTEKCHATILNDMFDVSLRQLTK